MNNDELFDRMKEHIDSFPDRNKQVEEMRVLMFGNARTHEKGMLEKVDEMHTILTQAKGIKGMLFILIAIGGALAVLKGFLMR